MKLKFWEDKLQEFKKLMDIKEKQTSVQKQYLKKAEKSISYLRKIPWIQMVWVWNSLSMNCWNKNSDIDLLIVTKENRMWIARIFSTIIFQILWIRKTSKKHAWRICLSFFCTKKWMNFWDFAIRNDIYLYFWIIYFKPILDYNNTYNDFIETNKNWACFDKYDSIIDNNKKYIKYTRHQEKYSSKLLSILEKILKFLFIKKTIKNYNKLWQPYWIIINNTMLKFHNNDKRKQIKKELWL